jgi:hypothetical protein
MKKIKYQLILTFYNSWTNESRQEVAEHYVTDALNKYTLQEYAEHLNEWTICDPDLVKMSFCFHCSLEESKEYKMTKDLHLNNGKVFFHYDYDNHELIIQ